MAQETTTTHLAELAQTHTLTPLASRLSAMPTETVQDMVELEAELRRAMSGDRGPGAEAAQYLLNAGGKRVRPLMCLLAARMFEPEGEIPHLGSLARVSELIHGATLLHDDVIDLGELRRGKPAARLVYGNALAVLGGDLLLVQSVQTVARAHVAELLGSLLDVLREMITAETLQLERRGRVDVTEDQYFEVARGKTGSLFRWAVEAGGRVAQAPRPLVSLLQTFGYSVGEAFQLVDDLLDLMQDPEDVGKTVMADLAGGTVTYPVIRVLDAAPELRQRLANGVETDATFASDLHEALRTTGALAATRREIRRRTDQAGAALDAFPAGWARDMLGAFVDELAERSR